MPVMGLSIGGNRITGLLFLDLLASLPLFCRIYNTKLRQTSIRSIAHPISQNINPLSQIVFYPDPIRQSTNRHTHSPTLPLHQHLSLFLSVSLSLYPLPAALSPSHPPNWRPNHPSTFPLRPALPLPPACNPPPPSPQPI